MNRGYLEVADCKFKEAKFAPAWAEDVGDPILPVRVVAEVAWVRPGVVTIRVCG